MRLTISEIMKAGGARLPVGSPSLEVDGAFVDSRDVLRGGLFVGIRGEAQDGGHYAPDALRAGAAAAVVGERSWQWMEGDFLAIGKPVLVSDNALGVLQAAGRLALEKTGARVIGVTGATGKTTTKDILLAMLLAAGARAEATPGNRNTEIGVPLSLMALREDTEIAVVEMGMRGMGQIAELARIAPPQVACITAIGPVHLELVGTVENVAAAKFELVQALPAGGTAVIPAGEPLLAPLLKTLDPDVRVVEFGDVPTLDIDLNLATAWQRRCAAAALECCRAIGAVPDAGTRIDVALSAMRGNIRALAIGGTLVEDCYNANPVAMKAALADLVGRPGRHVAVLADMMELGSQEDLYHREIGEVAAASGVDLLIAVGSRAAFYAQGADGIATVHFPTVEDAVAGVAEHLRPGDAVLLKGSRSMALERVADVIGAN
jgi:UDP-N-acetylmuramoyl-tripeptide--D-alanyl-D-alanine ligase